jgi:threonine aldolase
VVKGNWSPLLKASEALGADAVLYGTLDFDGKAAWNVKMVAAGDGAYAKWRMSSVSFDEALKGAIDRVAAAHAKQAMNDEGKKR